MHRVLSAGILVGLLSAPLAAQESATVGDSLPFHAGLRGTQFGLTAGGGGSIGFLRFLSPRRAWVVDAALTLQRSQAKSTSTFGGATNSSENRAWFGAVDLTTGLRSHHPLWAGALWFTGAGVGASYSRTSGEEYSTTRWSGGIYGEFGASYHVSPRMSFGAQSGVDFTYARDRSNSTMSRQTYSAWAVRTLPARLLITAYFR